MGLLSSFLKALGRTQKPGYSPKFSPPQIKGPAAESLERERLGRPALGLPSVVAPKVGPPYGWDITPDDAEFLLELGMAPEDVTTPYVVPDLTEPVMAEAAARHVLSGEWTHVQSSNVDAFRFVAPDGLDVGFLSGSVYRYRNCPPAVALRFYESPSAGKFVWYVLRMNPQKFPFMKLRDADRDARGRVLFAPKRRWRLLLGGRKKKRR